MIWRSEAQVYILTRYRFCQRHAADFYGNELTAWVDGHVFKSQKHQTTLIGSVSKTLQLSSYPAWSNCNASLFYFDMVKPSVSRNVLM